MGMPHLIGGLFFYEPPREMMSSGGVANCRDSAMLWAGHTKSQ